MKVAEYINKVIEDQGRNKTWVADRCEINYKTFVDKLKNNRFTADDLLKVSKVLNINLENMKEELK